MNGPIFENFQNSGDLGRKFLMLNDIFCNPKIFELVQNDQN